jgi:hypothetical protein
MTKPHREPQGSTGRHAPGAPCARPETWFTRQPLDTGFERAAAERTARWMARKKAAASGQPTLSVAELDELIARTRAAAESAEPDRRGYLQTQLEDMGREAAWRKFLGEEHTNWPALSAHGQGQAATP